MRISAQAHYDRTRWFCDLGMLVGFVGLAAGLLLLTWNRLPATLAAKVIITAIVLAAVTWPRLILGRLLCEIARECLSAQCSKCGGPAWFDASEEGSFSTKNVTYTCHQCGYQEVLKACYGDEDPKPGDGAGHDGLGGGGG